MDSLTPDKRTNEKVNHTGGIFINTKLAAAFNKQMNMEFYSEYFYRAMAAYCHLENFKGFGAWLDVQADEEHEHGMKFYHYLLERGVKVEFQKMDQPPAAYKSLLDVAEKIYEHEKDVVTKNIHKLYELALETKDYPAQIFLHWFINEQVEEEANASEIVEKLRLIGDKSSGSLFALDHQLGKRKKGC